MENRQQEIQDAAIDMVFHSKLLNMLTNDFREAFVQGANWADNHPYVPEVTNSESIPPELL